MSWVSREEALAILRENHGPDATFRPHQWECIDRLVNDRERLLVVQRTGWGKSTVYFIATRVLRDCGHGPTLIVSPLLALMRNQVADAEAALGLRAETINSSNTGEWSNIREGVTAGDVDLLLISPERLSNEGFQRRILSEIVDDLGLLVIDEAHCISNWGHDFRPDYRRLGGVLETLPDEVPVAATTATANDRVVEDVTDQLPGLDPVRGDLVRESLRLQTVEVASRAERLAWLAETVPDLDGSGIVYCLITGETENVAGWLSENGLEVRPYHGGMDGEVRREREEQLMANEVAALVATNALGMGFNKPDLAWVVHYQRPPNLIRYYQEIGRAGRALDEATVVLLSGQEDDAIAEYFIDQAFPTPAEFQDVLATITDSEEPLYKYQLLRRLDISYQTASSCLNILSVEGAITKGDDGFVRTDKNWTYDHDRVEEVTAHRRAELERIQEYVTTDRCLMRFVDDELDGQLDEPCGRCANCAGPVVSPEVQDQDLVEEAIGYYRSDGWREIPPRYYDHRQSGGRSKIPERHQLEPGRALSVYKDPGWGSVVHEQKHEAGRFGEDLVDASADFLTEWDPSPEPEWVTAVPSTRFEGLVTGFAERLAGRLGLDYVDGVRCAGSTELQADLQNSYQRCWNVSGAFDVTQSPPDSPVLLVDDIVGSRWTLTEVGTNLRRAGSGPVVPFTLAERRAW